MPQLTLNFETKSPINRDRLTGQNKRLYDHLSAGNTITSFEAFSRFGISRLASRIWDLKEAGCTIYDRFIKVEGIDVKQYSFTPFQTL